MSQNNQSVISKSQEYNGLGSGWCDVPYCKQGAKWWTCSKCGHCSCGEHQAFNGKSVSGCYWCRPDIWTKRYITKRRDNIE